MARTCPSESTRGPPWKAGPSGASCWMPAEEISATKPWVIAAPCAPSPDNPKTRSPRVGLWAAKSSLGWPPTGRMMRARSFCSCHVETYTLVSVEVVLVRGVQNGGGQGRTEAERENEGIDAEHRAGKAAPPPARFGLHLGARSLDRVVRHGRGRGLGHGHRGNRTPAGPGRR